MYVQEMHKVTAAEVTVGYFTLDYTPSSTHRVAVTIVGGIQQVNKHLVGSTGLTPDFDVIDDEIHINNNGDATGLSEEIVADDVLIVDYHE